MLGYIVDSVSRTMTKSRSHDTRSRRRYHCGGVLPSVGPFHHVITTSTGPRITFNVQSPRDGRAERGQIVGTIEGRGALRAHTSCRYNEL